MCVWECLYKCVCMGVFVSIVLVGAAAAATPFVLNVEELRVAARNFKSGIHVRELVGRE